MPYDLTFKWKLINKTSKQNITRDIEIKKTLTVTEGRWEGIMGVRKEGFSGTTIKDTWTKPRGGGIREGGGDAWGEGGVVGGKCRKLYLNNNKIILKRN